VITGLTLTDLDSMLNKYQSGVCSTTCDTSSSYYMNTDHVFFIR